LVDCTNSGQHPEKPASETGVALLHGSRESIIRGFSDDPPTAKTHYTRRPKLVRMGKRRGIVERSFAL
jgi:hypothetical protein